MKLHGYQRTAVAHLHSGSAALFMDMGLGKTLCVLAALTPEHLPALVVAPPEVAQHTWDAEVEKWGFDLKVGKATGGPAERAEVLADPSYDVVTVSWNSIPLPGGRRWRTLVLDELSGYKSLNKRWKAAKRLRNHVDHVWGLTGTPVPNGYENLWPQLYLLDGGAALGRTLTGYRERHFTQGRRLPTGAIIDRQLRPGQQDVINDQIAPLCLSMDAKTYLPDLPPRTDNPVDVRLAPAHRRLYETLRADLVADLDALGLGTLVHRADTAAALTNLLHQVNAGFLYEHAEETVKGVPRRMTKLHTNRAKAVQRIADETGGPLLVAYRYRPELDQLRDVFGSALHTTKSKDVFRKWNAGQVPVLAAHPSSLGHGLNLQHGGHTSVWMSPTWDAELWDQFNGRLPRQGQTHPVLNHMLQTPGTVDERLFDALRNKLSVQQALRDYLDSPV